MKPIKIILTIITIGLSFGSCRKYVDIRESSLRNRIETAKDCQLLLDNYSTMNTSYPNDGFISADDYSLTDQGYRSSDIKQTDRDLYVWLPTAIRDAASTQWNPYRTVYFANLVLEALEKLQGKENQAILDGLKGAALFYRAFSFWQVAQLYTKPYNVATSGSDPGIPLRLQSDISYTSGRGTVQQTYNQIVQDLQQAASLLPITSPNNIASQPNKTAAYAMLARTYLSMEDYPNALTNANLALPANVSDKLIDYNTLSFSSGVPFYPRYNKEVLFHAITAGSNALDWSYDPGNLANVPAELVTSYENNDLRKDVFFVDADGSGQFYYFNGNYEPINYSGTFFIGLAVDEVLLIKAECLARAGNANAAIDALNALLVTRWKKVSGLSTYVNMTAATPDIALEIILTERRKELLMRGLRWSDLRRLNRDPRFAKTLTRSVQGVTYTLPPNDPRYTLLIPQEVITNSGIAQNQR